MRGPKKKIGIFLLICSFILLIWGINSNLTGNVISEYFSNTLTIIHILGLIFLLFGAVLFLERKSLDAVIIPTGHLYERNIKRAKRGSEEKAKYYIISGYLDKNKPVRESQTADIYNALIKYGINSSDIKIERRSKDSLENAIFSLNKLKGLKTIGIVSYPEHLKRFEYIINKAKKELSILNTINLILNNN